ncbi:MULTISPECIES: helix-turn-helix transcriptional regulator [unclassified Sulfitobacter]|uniref:helix-turn-helix transcriptional regulator n=1 Tax=unclassified Sulfitobacter TaxID=196795 RepID=UPI0020C7B6BB|nr:MULTISPECIES: LuxR C-terminal-related transcriptional regulator [unclassified Sulfitobacter]
MPIAVPQTSFQAFSEKLASVIDGQSGADRFIEAVSALYPCEAAFAVLNRPNASPVYLADSYADLSSKAAVQRYVTSTFEINPVHNAIRGGLGGGVYRMADLAPDNWSATTADVIADDAEEISFRTPGWPQGLREVSVLVELEDGMVGEISLARAAASKGIPDADLDALRSVLPLIRSAFLRLASNSINNLPLDQTKSRSLASFGNDILSPREAEIIQMILKGHSSLSISLSLDIALPTVKSHRRNAYAKLGISTQQQLFHAYLKSREPEGEK